MLFRSTARESKMKFFKTIKELREQNEKLQARVADLEQAASVSEWIKCTEQLPTEDAGTDLDMSVTIGTFQR